jgi:hypothetical protein
MAAIVEPASSLPGFFTSKMRSVLSTSSQATKSSQYYYVGAKEHIGVDSKKDIVHSVCASRSGRAATMLLTEGTNV